MRKRCGSTTMAVISTCLSYNDVAHYDVTRSESARASYRTRTSLRRGSTFQAIHRKQAELMAICVAVQEECYG